MYRAGFTEAAGNFQRSNFGRGGLANDDIPAEIQDSAGTNNVNFATLPDGTRPRSQLFIFTATALNIDRDAALDNQIVIHELTHGLSNRLHGNGTGLGTQMAQGLGEGWSVFFN